jgi:small subunit ribosomal protein S1
MAKDNINDINMDFDGTFADLLNESFVDNEYFEPGQMIEATIVKIAGGLIFLYVGGKSEGYLEAGELIDKNGTSTAKEGDKIKAFFLSSQNGELHFTTKISGNKAGQAIMQTAFENGIPIEGFVEKEVKGGFEIKIGSSRAFCPYSQMGLERESPEKFIGQHLSFKISEYAERGRNIILSNRAILEEKQKEKVETLKKKLKEGTKIKGTVKSIQDFGAFVDIGGVQALLPISELSRSRVEDIRTVLSVGQEIEAVILSLNWETGRISLSAKELQPDPWNSAAAKYPSGTRQFGKVARVTNFGVFVTLEPGLDGLIHISGLGGGTRIKHPRDVVSEGQSIEVIVDSVDMEKKRISLIPVLQKTEEEKDFEQYTEQKSDSFKAMGNLGDLFKGKLNKK